MKIPQRLVEGRGPHEPITPEEWQVAVDGANAMLVIVRARAYGFIVPEAGPKINVERCEQMLARGKALGYHPQRAVVEEFARGFAKDGEEDDLAAVLLSVHDEVRDEAPRRVVDGQARPK